MKRVTMLVIVLGVASAAAAFGPFTRWQSKDRVVVESEPFVVTTLLPDGWSLESGQVLPPESLRSACRLHRELLRGSDWNTLLAGALRESKPTWREQFKLHGHLAVEYKATTGSRATESVYVNLDDIQQGAIAIWSVDGDHSEAGRQCRFDFDALVHTVAIDLPR